MFLNDRQRNLSKRKPDREQGFTYIALLMLVAMMGVMLASSGQLLSAAMKREKEQELIFVGNQFRNAISMYYKNSVGQTARYPMSLEDLLRDPRQPDTRRYLRKIYLDPISNSTEWGLVKGPNGEIYGVHSLSMEEPLKKSNFSLIDHQFEGMMQYADWVFMAAVQATGAPQAPVGQFPAQQGPASQTPVSTGPVGQTPIPWGPVSQTPVTPGSVGQTPVAPGSVGQTPVAPGTVGQMPVAPRSVGQAPVTPGPVGQMPVQPGPIRQYIVR